MAILPISGVRVSNNTNRTSFTSLRMGEAETIDNPDNQKPRKNKLASVPVALLIAMSPAMMNGDEPVKAIPLDSDKVTELLAYAAPSESTAPQVGSTAQANYPLGMKQLSFKKIFAQFPIVTADGERATLVYSGSKEWDGKPNKNHVQFIYYIPQKHNMPANAVILPEVRAFVYHDLGEGKEFASIEVKSPEYKNGKRIGYIRKEIKLKDDDANEIISFLAGEREYKNNTFNLEIKETTSPALMTPKRTDY